MKRAHGLAVYIIFLVNFFSLTNGEPVGNIYQKGFLSIEEARKSIELPDGYSLELVLSEPQIEEPVAMAWDGNGVLYVVEMRTYMQTADATDEQTPKSRISRHEDTNGDGTYDKSTVFIDNLLLPRMVLPLDDQVMVGITNTLDLWNYRDSDGDGVADEKKKIFEGGKRGGNMEHQPSGLIWALDNWIYLTYQNVRYRFVNGELETQKLPRGGGQWGLTQDDDGRLYYSTGGGENPAFFFQQPPAYGMFDVGGQTEADFRSVFPIASVPDVQGGPRRVGKNGALNVFTGCAGQGIYRGDRLPEEMYGDLFIPEPVGRLIRRAKVNRKDGMTVLSNATPGSEFIRSKDINFRPLGAETAPDGTMFFIDMHRGIIQQGNWTRKGSYLRGVIDKWQIDKNVGKGRIYRLVHKDHKPGPQPTMLGQATKQLVGHLSHPNGWWRDTAQKLIVLRKDGKSVVPELENHARSAKSPLGRVHALWTLEGMDAVDPELIVEKLSDDDHRVRMAAVRISEPFLSGGNKALETAFQKLKNDPHIDVALQTINSIAYSGTTSSEVLAGIQNNLIEKYSDKPILKSIVGNRAKLADEDAQLAKQRKMDAHFGKQMERGAVIYKQLCFTCHGNDGKGTPMAGQSGITLAPPLPKSVRVLGSGGSLVRTVLHGLQGPLDGKTYPGQMLPLGANDDEWIASVSTYVRNSFGNKGGPITKEFVAGIRKESADRLLPWTEAELEELEPPLMPDRTKWRLTASHGSEKLSGCIDGNGKSRYDTGASQIPGMWVQVELPSVSKVNRIQLDSKSSSRDYPRGYLLESSIDGEKWSEPLATGFGKHPMTDISFPTTEAKFLKITQTGKVSGLYWSIHEMQIFGKPTK